MGMILTINTNGTLIDETWADFFAQHPPRRINITLYGRKPTAISVITKTGLKRRCAGFVFCGNGMLM